MAGRIKKAADFRWPSRCSLSVVMESTRGREGNVGVREGIVFGFHGAFVAPEFTETVEIIRCFTLKPMVLWWGL